MARHATIWILERKGDKGWEPENTVYVTREQAESQAVQSAHDEARYFQTFVWRVVEYTAVHS